MFYGWRVVGGSFIAMMLVVGFFTYSFTLLVTPIREEFGATLAQVMFSLTLGTLLGLLMSPLSGHIIDRYPMRPVMTIGCLVVAAGFWGLSVANSILVFNIVFGLTFSLGNGLAGSMAGSAVVSRWFVRSRGKALGITTIGTSVGGMLLPVVVTYWLAQSGWRGTMENLALLTLLVVTPVVWLTIRGRPEDLGMVAEGAEDGTLRPQGAGGVGGSMGEIIRRREFWYIGLSVGLLIAVFSSMMANLSPYATQLGASKAQAANLITGLALAGLLGKIAFGMAADHFSLKVGMWSAHGLVTCGFLILAAEPSYPLIMVASLCLGLATGGLLPVWNAMMAEVFGVDSYGRAMGAMGPLITLLIIPAYMIIGRLYDSTGSYTTWLLLSVGVLALAAALLWPLRLLAPGAQADAVASQPAAGG